MRENMPIRKTNKQATAYPKLFLNYEEASARYGLGETSLRKMAKECHALYKIGGAARIRIDTMDQYIESFLDESE